MTELPETSRAVVYDPDGGALSVRSLPVRPSRPGEILARVTLSAVCGSDLHTISGRRRPRGAIILGHEICGTVAQLGQGVSHDGVGRPLSLGDRITWSIAASCGDCFFCGNGIPQKCTSLYKYGHESIDIDPPLNGGFAEYVYLAPGTAVYRIPDDLGDDTVVFANCSLATMAAAMRLAEVSQGESVLIQGAGLVGVCASALASARGADVILAVDVDDDRLDRVRRFGATHVFNAAGASREDFSRAVADALASRTRSIPAASDGFDVAMEVCGRPEVIPLGIESLRIGGRYVLAGCVFPDASTELDVFSVITRLIRIIGLHNYTPADLHSALVFLGGQGREFPFDTVVAERFPLDQIARALDTIEERKDILRVALAP